MSFAASDGLVLVLLMASIRCDFTVLCFSLHSAGMFIVPELVVVLVRGVGGVLPAAFCGRIQLHHRSIGIVRG